MAFALLMNTLVPETYTVDYISTWMFQATQCEVT
jgi:hypothetical protein